MNVCLLVLSAAAAVAGIFRCTRHTILSFFFVNLGTNTLCGAGQDPGDSLGIKIAIVSGN